MEEFKEKKINENFIRILKGSIVSLIITMLLLLLFAVVLTYTDIPEIVINPVIIIVTFISLFVGSLISSLHLKKNGLINGALVGLVYIGTLYIISSIINGSFLLNIYSFIMILLAILAGMIGGIIGINIK